MSENVAYSLPLAVRTVRDRYRARRDVSAAAKTAGIDDCTFLGGLLPGGMKVCVSGSPEQVNGFLASDAMKRWNAADRSSRGKK